MTSVVWAPAIGVAITVLLAAGSLAAWAWSTLRHRRGYAQLILRTVFIAAIGAILLGPSTLRSDDPQRQRPAVALLFDRSLSMCVADEQLAGAGARRIDAVRAGWLSEGFLRRLRDRAEPRLLAFDDSAVPTTPSALRAMEPSGQRTRLVHSADALLTAPAPAGSLALSDLVLLTDGVDTDDPSSAALASLSGRARAAGVRLHACVVGRDERPSDVSVHLSADQSNIQEGEAVTLRVRVRQSGFTGRSAVLSVREGGAGGREVIRRVVALAPGLEIVATASPRRPPGADVAVSPVEYVASIDPLPGEADASNNTDRAMVQVGAGRIRVALFEDQPYWDSKFFIAAMRADPQVELTSVIGLGPRRQRVSLSSPALAGPVERELLSPPLTERELFAFDVVVLGRGVERWFGGERAHLLERFVVERGGSLVFLRAAPTLGDMPDSAALRDALAGVSPVEWGRGALAGSRLARTEAGWREPLLDFSTLVAPSAAPPGAARGPGAILSELPAMLAATRIEREKSLSIVWLRQTGVTDPALAPSTQPSASPGVAAVAHMSVGRGRSFAILTDGLWRWAFAPAEQRDAASVYRVFWGRAIRWLAFAGEFLPAQSIALAVDQPTTQPGRPVVITASSRYFEADAPALTLRIREPDGRETPLVLSRADAAANRWTGVFTPTQAGVHDVDFVAFRQDSAGRSVAGERAFTRFVAREDRTELLDTAARRDEMAALVESTGGRMLAPDRPEDLFDALSDHERESQSAATPRPIWDNGRVFAGLLALIGFEWFWRRRKGMA